MTGGARTPAVAVVLLAGLVAWLAAPPLSAAGPFSFPHRPHLSAAAIAAGGAGAGSDADCRTCHDYAKGGRDVHLGGCDKCHVDSKHLEVKRTDASARPAFQHKEHLYAKDGSPRGDVSCFTCHAMRVDYDFIEFTVPTAGLGPKGAGKKGGGAHGEKTCADCHAAHETKGGLVAHDEKTGDGKACADCHMRETSILPQKYRGDQRPAATRPFAHADHGGPAADCAACHAEIKSSRTIWDYDPTKGTAEKCATCHVDKDGPLVAPRDGPLDPLKRVDFSNFPHSKHLGEFSRMTCATCHYPETDEQGRRVFPGRTASAEPVGRNALVNFKACDVCHGHDGWGPDKKSWHVENHGVGAWACFKCHEGSVDAAGKLAIANAQVVRPSLNVVNFKTHAHPGVTKKGAPLADATQDVHGTARVCADCHVAGVPEKDSRLTGRAFDHAPHLTGSPKTAECVACHPTSSTARRSEDLTAIDGTRVPQCLECHVGAKPEDLDFHRDKTGVVVPQFDHANHVRSASLVAGEKGIGCVECHVKGGEAGYTTPPDVRNCTKCHAHEGDDVKVKRTGPKTSSGDAAACRNCHDAPRADARMPSVDAPARRRLVLSAGVQFHDKTGDCAACHVREGAAATPYEERIRSAKVSLSIHDDPAFADKPFNDPKGKCDECHRVPPRGYLRSLKR